MPAAWIGLATAAYGAYNASQQPSGRDQINGNMDLAYATPRYTGRSGLNTNGWGESRWPGAITIDPTIRDLRHESLGRMPGYRNTLGSAYQNYDSMLGGLQTQLSSNQNPYIQARVNPLLQQQAVGRQNLTNSFARRGIFGDLYTNALANYDTTTGRGIADQGALATRENINSQLGVSGARYSGATDYISQLRGMDTQQQAVAAADLQQELSALGLGAPDMSAVLQASGFGNQVNQQNNAMFGRALYGLGGSLGQIAGQYQGGGGGGLSSAWGGVTPDMYSGYYG